MLREPKRIVLTILSVVTVKPVFGQAGLDPLRISQVLADWLATQLAPEKTASFPCILAVPYGADRLLVSAPARADSMSRAMAQQQGHDSSHSDFLHELLTTSTNQANLDTVTVALLSSLARIIRESDRTIDTIDVRELGIFSFRVEDDSAALGLAYGGFMNTPAGTAFWDVLGYRFNRSADGWRITTDTALFFADGRRILFSPASATHLTECLR